MCVNAQLYAAVGAEDHRLWRIYVHHVGSGRRHTYVCRPVLALVVYGGVEPLGLRAVVGVEAVQLFFASREDDLREFMSAGVVGGRSVALGVASGNVKWLTASQIVLVACHGVAVGVHHNLPPVGVHNEVAAQPSERVSCVDEGLAVENEVFVAIAVHAHDACLCAVSVADAVVVCGAGNVGGQLIDKRFHIVDRSRR